MESIISNIIAFLITSLMGFVVYWQYREQLSISNQKKERKRTKNIKIDNGN